MRKTKMFFKDKKVVVTGGSGFVGTHYIEELLNRGAIVKTHVHERPLQINDDRIEVIYDLDLTNIDDCMMLIDGADYVVHSAGNIANPKLVPTDFQIALNQITLITNVLEASYKCGVKGFVDINSSTGYPDRRLPITEETLMSGNLERSNEWYAIAKIAGIKLCQAYRKQYNCDFVSAMPTNLYGPNDNFDLETCHVVPALIRRVLSDENPFVAWGSPDVVRDFLYVKDVVNGALLILEKGESMRPYNLGYGSTVTIGDILNTILEVTGKSPEIRWDNTKPTTIPFRMVSTKRIKEELGFEPTYTFKQGIEKTINWYLKNGR